jgi:hypothetical protein
MICLMQNIGIRYDPRRTGKIKISSRQEMSEMVFAAIAVLNLSPFTLRGAKALSRRKSSSQLERRGRKPELPHIV